MCEMYLSDHKPVFQGTGRKRENRRENVTILRSLLAMRFLLELQKLLIKYSNNGVRLLFRDFSLLHNLEFFARK